MYIAIASSWYHMLGIASYFNGNKIKAKKLIIVVGGFFGFIPQVNKDFFSKYANEIIVLNSFEALEKEYLPIKKGQRVSLIAPSFHPFRVANILKHKKIPFEIIVTEEGLGTYADYLSNIKGQWRAINTTSKAKKIKIIIKKIIFTEIKKILLLKINRKYWLNFDKNTSKINSKVVESYKSVLASTKKIDFDIDLQDAKILIITSPFVEIGLANSEEYRNYLQEKFKGKTGIYIKPHPIENKEKYQGLGVIIDSTIPMELILSKFPNQTTLYAFSSTVLYTAKLFFGMQVVRLKEFDKFHHSLSKNQKEIINIVSTSQ